MSPFTLGELCAEAQQDGKRLEAELLLAELLGWSREKVFSYPEHRLTEEQQGRFEALWGRMMDGEPVAYLVGRKEFFGLTLHVDSRVLVPRPETEHLVERIVELVKGMEAPRVLDVGTGSGAIALAVAHTLPQAVVFGSDVSADAVDVAQENGKALGLERVEFFVSDLLAEVPMERVKPDVLVANLPYIGETEFHFVERAVEKYEPSVALMGGFDGLDLYRDLFEQISCSKNVPRWVLGEFGSLQRECLEEVMKKFLPSARVQFETDLAGLDRTFVLELS